MRDLDLATLELGVGKHDAPGQVMCLTEAVAYLTGETHSDHPECVSPVLGSYGRKINDLLPYELRQQLKPLIPRLVGTAGDGKDGARSYLALDWLVRTYLVTWLDLYLASSTEHATRHLSTEDAARLRGLEPIVDARTAQKARVKVKQTLHRIPTLSAPGRSEGFRLYGIAGGARKRAIKETAVWESVRSVDGAIWHAASTAVGHLAMLSALGAAMKVWFKTDNSHELDDLRRAAVRTMLEHTLATLQSSAIDLFTSMIDPTAGGSPDR
ncbi:hypothetical protein [Sphaerisporangium perillae]|uniref:hypothetical protein n=1 Tax=Sphaerisporangium perillae TaxID=2935860 RepID=UPI00200DA4C8|nr:hypothetical protein [Sphaerisporangium perillae]